MIGEKAHGTGEDALQITGQRQRARQHRAEFFLFDRPYHGARDVGAIQHHEFRRFGCALVEGAAKIGPDRSRADHSDMDAVRLELVVEALGEADLGEFGRAIGRYLRRSHDARDRGYVDNCSRAPRDHRRQYFLGAIDGAEIVGAQHCFDRLDRRLGERLVAAESRVVDEDVDAPEFRQRAAYHTPDGGGVAHVAFDDLRRAAEAPEFRGGVGETLERAARRDDGGAAGGEVEGELPPDAARSPGHECDAIFKIHSCLGFARYTRTIFSSASRSAAYRKGCPGRAAPAGTARWPVSRTSAISPKARRSTNAGTGAQLGRRSVLPSVVQNSFILTGSGAVAFTAPRAFERMRNSINPISSSRWIHGIHCLPEPSGPPRKNLNGGTIFVSAPPLRPSTIPVRSKTTRAPEPSARSASASQSRQRRARKSLPGGSLSVTISSPRGP